MPSMWLRNKSLSLFFNIFHHSQRVKYLRITIDSCSLSSAPGDSSEGGKHIFLGMTMMKTRKCTEIYIYSIWHWQWCRSRWLDVSTNWAFSGFSDGEEISGIDWIRRPASICGSDSVHVWLDFLWGHILRQGEMAIALFMWHCTIFNERHIPCVAEIFYTFTLNISRKVEDDIFKIFFCWNISCRVELRFVGYFNKHSTGSGHFRSMQFAKLIWAGN